MSIGKAYALALSLSLSLPAIAAEPVKIGVITTLSGPGGYLGQDALDAFKLGIVDGKLGGVAVQLLSEDAAMNPGNAKRIAERFLQAEKVKIVTGTIFTNVAEAIVPDVLEAGAFYVGPNSGPTEFSGKGCHKNYFTVGFQTAVPHRAAGLYANKLGYKNMFLLVPNYQAGKDAMEGFKQTYQGKIAGEIYIKIGQTDFSAELAQIRAAHPDALWMLLPGGLGINFLKQYGLAGLNQTIPIVIAEPAFDDRMMAATGDASLGLKIVTFWNGDFENAANRSFVENFKKTYGRTPTVYAAQGYDTAQAIASALKAVGGDLSAQDAFRAALVKADFPSVRGRFAFGNNHQPIEDYYTSTVVKENGVLKIKTLDPLIADYRDPYADQCKM